MKPPWLSTLCRISAARLAVGSSRRAAGARKQRGERFPAWNAMGATAAVYPRQPASTGNAHEGGDAAPNGDRRMTRMAGVTHELRTPLTILKGRLHGIEDGVIALDGAEAARLLRQVDHVLALVNDLDTVAGYELGRFALDRRSVDLTQIVRRVVADLRPLLARHDLTLCEYYAPAVVNADPVRMTQIVTNVLTNAAKHSVSGGQVHVRVGVYGGDAVFSVLDQGPGLALADKERLFAPFWQSDATIKRPGCYGTGMGLALTARLVEAHGGRIMADNRSDAPGARFDVLIPVA